jgi:thymidylate kinase
MAHETLDPDEILNQKSPMHTVVFEGIDKVGKSSLMKALYKKLTYKITCIDRLYLSTFVYDLLRRQKEQAPFEFLEQNVESIIQMCAAFNQFSNAATLVYVRADMDVVVDRMKQNGHEAYFEGSLPAFESGLRMIKKLCPELRIIVIDTTVKSIDECVEELCKALWRAE